MQNRTNAALAVCVVALAIGCSDAPVGEDNPMAVPLATTNIPTFVEQVGSDGRITDLVAPIEPWTGAYPVRIIRKDENGKIVSDQVVTKPPSSLVDAIRHVPLTDAQLVEMEAMLRDFAAERPESNATAALEEVRKIRRTR